MMQRDLVSSANDAANPKNIGLTSFNEDAISLTDVQNDLNTQNTNTPPENTTQTENTKSTDKETESGNQNQEVEPKELKEVELGLNNSQSVDGKDVMGDTLLAKLDETKKKSKGDTIDVKNQEEDDQKSNKENAEGLRTKINNYISNIFGTKAEKDTEEQKIALKETKFDLSSQSLETEANKVDAELKSAIDKAYSNIGDDIIAFKKPITKVQLDNRKKNNTITIIEKPVQVASNQGGVISGKYSKLNLDFATDGMNDSETMKKIQTIIFNT